LCARNEPLRARNEPLCVRNEPLCARNDPLRVRNEPLRARNDPLRARNDPLSGRNGLVRLRNKSSHVGDKTAVSDVSFQLFSFSECEAGRRLPSVIRFPWPVKWPPITSPGSFLLSQFLTFPSDFRSA
jgi:hypothetical protein